LVSSIKFEYNQSDMGNDNILLVNIGTTFLKQSAYLLVNMLSQYIVDVVNKTIFRVKYFNVF